MAVSPDLSSNRYSTRVANSAVHDLLVRSHRLLVITGAGISTNSGISDYRDAAGQWKRAAPVQHQDFMASHRWRQRYWARSQLGYPEFLRAQPNPAHHILADWERQGRLVGLITQNVDRLHQRAGHQRVIDLHGRLDQVICTGCARVVPRDNLQRFLDQHNQANRSQHFVPGADGDAEVPDAEYAAIQVPVCSDCGGILKPHVVFFGDSVPQPVVQQAYDWVDQADLVLVVGTSLMVFSSFRFVRRAHAAGTPVIAVNQGVTRADELLSGKVDGDCAEVLTALDKLIEITPHADLTR
ncbi:MAG: NAD-dependent protein deacetylase [Pseudomonadota bacterium]